MDFKIIKGGVTTPKGFLASGLHCGLKRVKKDLALIYSEVPAIAAGVFTKNVIKAAPIYITKEHLKNPNVQAIICNSGNANTCTGDDGLKKALEMTIIQAKALNINPDEVLVASTGVIGTQLKIELIKKQISNLTKNLSKSGNEDAAYSILTTDKYPKSYAIKFKIDDSIVTIGAISKGSGMVHPNMGTILSFITTDIAIEPNLLKEALIESVNLSYNRISVDGDTSTNDTVLIMANGLSKNKLIDTKDDRYYSFVKALNKLNISLAREIARDGDGATKLLECTVCGADTEDACERISKKIITSKLIKASLFQSNLDFGKIINALSSINDSFDINNLNIYISNTKTSIQICENGSSKDIEDIKLKQLLEDDDEIKIKIIFSNKNTCVTCWGCDLPYEYIRVTGDYRNLKGGY
ncbi:MAG: bifunctional glutamate N-acetyltransferase/amino-acid acetyltransferase ArgJ [Clostridium sp.]|nr:bifunctional glutamate N-acetyltransferase/amino-acid acetyltransferase ArgJ [Clostridium sp.]